MSDPTTTPTLPLRQLEAAWNAREYRKMLSLVRGEVSEPGGVGSTEAAVQTLAYLEENGVVVSMFANRLRRAVAASKSHESTLTAGYYSCRACFAPRLCLRPDIDVCPNCGHEGTARRIGDVPMSFDPTADPREATTPTPAAETPAPVTDSLWWLRDHIFNNIELCGEGLDRIDCVSSRNGVTTVATSDGREFTVRVDEVVPRAETPDEQRVRGIRERLEKATPGPWGWNSYNAVQSKTKRNREEEWHAEWEAAGKPSTESGRPTQEWQERLLDAKRTVCYVPPTYGDTATGQRADDAVFIAGAPDDIAYLLAENARLKEYETMVNAASRHFTSSEIPKPKPMTPADLEAIQAADDAVFGDRVGNGETAVEAATGQERERLAVEVAEAYSAWAALSSSIRTDAWSSIRNRAQDRLEEANAAWSAHVASQGGAGREG